MRPGQSPITPALVPATARDAPGVAPAWAPFRPSVPVRRLLDLILLVAATARTVSAVGRSRFGVPHEAARRAVRADLPDLPTLTGGLADAWTGPSRSPAGTAAGGGWWGSTRTTARSRRTPSGCPARGRAWPVGTCASGGRRERSARSGG